MRNELERVARAMHDDACADDDCGGGDLGEYERQAEIAIAALTPTTHGPVTRWRNDGGPWREGSKCKCGDRWPHPTPDVGVLAEVRALHHPVDVEPGETICAECSPLYGESVKAFYLLTVEWPCETVCILDGEAGR